jgi:hypothetical protein
VVEGNGVISIFREDFTNTDWIDICNRVNLNPDDTDILEIHSRAVIGLNTGDEFNLEEFSVVDQEEQLNYYKKKKEEYPI